MTWIRTRTSSGWSMMRSGGLTTSSTREWRSLRLWPGVRRRITAVDLLRTRSMLRVSAERGARPGNALERSPDGEYDAVLLVMLIHHLVGTNVSETEENLERCLSECFRVMKPGGKLIIVESCVPNRVYLLERLLFPVLNYLISRFAAHPMAFQYPQAKIAHKIRSVFGECRTSQVQKGRYVIQLGWKVPSLVTPVQPFLFTASSPDSVCSRSVTGRAPQRRLARAVWPVTLPARRCPPASSATRGGTHQARDSIRSNNSAHRAEPPSRPGRSGAGGPSAPPSASVRWPADSSRGPAR